MQIITILPYCYFHEIGAMLIGILIAYLKKYLVMFLMLNSIYRFSEIKFHKVEGGGDAFRKSPIANKAGI